MIGVVKHIGDILKEILPNSRHNLIAIGIAPWGVVNEKDSLLGCGVCDFWFDSKFDPVKKLIFLYLIRFIIDFFSTKIALFTVRCFIDRGALLRQSAHGQHGQFVQFKQLPFLFSACWWRHCGQVRLWNKLPSSGWTFPLQTQVGDFYGFWSE